MSALLNNCLKSDHNANLKKCIIVLSAKMIQFYISVILKGILIVKD